MVDTGINLHPVQVQMLRQEIHFPGRGLTHVLSPITGVDTPIYGEHPKVHRDKIVFNTGETRSLHWVPGTRLWVREFHQIDVDKTTRYASDVLMDGPWTYPLWTYRTPSTMPKWASRYTLEAQEIDVRRIQSITDQEISTLGYRCSNTKDPRYTLISTWDKKYRNAHVAHMRYRNNPWVLYIRVVGVRKHIDSVRSSDFSMDMEEALN